jgi:TRAP-type mannitol/chloroaromatic compound transport system permease small subunit
MDKVIRMINTISLAIGKLVAPLTAVITGLVFYEVICRYFLNAATTWTAEVENYLQITIVMLGGAYGLSHGGHVRVDVLHQHFKERTKALVDIFTALLVMLISFPMIWFGGRIALEAFLTGQTSSSAAELTLWPSMATVPAGAALLALQSLALASSAIKRLLNSRRDI